LATVLVIEDDPTTRQTIRKIVEEGGHDVWEAANGADGVKLCRLLLPDLVITDIMMPIQDGITTLVELKALFTGAKFIAMSGHPDKLDLALRLGARDVFQKPINLQELGEAIQEAVENFKSRPGSVRPVYVRVELYDEEDPPERIFTLSPVPFWEGLNGDIRPTKEESTIVTTYADLRQTLLKKFGIPRDLIPFREFFDPTPEEMRNEETVLYRTLPEGLGEPEWRTRADQAVRETLEEAITNAFFATGRVGIEIDQTFCTAMDALRCELEKIAEDAGGKPNTPDEPYGPNYQDLVDGILSEYSKELIWLGVKGKKRRR
jgi:CheY-like chemotaxis protein